MKTEKESLINVWKKTTVKISSKKDVRMIALGMVFGITAVGIYLILPIAIYNVLPIESLFQSLIILILWIAFVYMEPTSPMSWFKLIMKGWFNVSF